LSVIPLLNSLLELGIKLRADEDRLVVNAPTGAMTTELAAAIRANKAAILALLREVGDSAAVAQGVPAPVRLAEATGTVSLSQERIWSVSQMHPGTVHYNLPGAWRLRGPLNEAALERAVQGLCDRHSLLRSRFVPVDGMGVRLSTDERRNIELERIDLTDAPRNQVDALAKKKMEELAVVPFDLGADYLFRAYLFRLGGGDFLFYVVTHSIIWDAWSFDIMLEETGKLYEQAVDAPTAPLAELAIRYDDYAWSQRARRDTPEMSAALGYWTSHLAGELAPLRLPVDFPRSSAIAPHGARYNFVVSSELAMRVFAYCKSSAVTPYMVFLAGYALLLSRYADTDSVVVTTAVRGREHEDLERLIGTFTNNVFFRLRVDENQSFESLVAYVKHLVLDGFAHQQCPVESVLDALNVDLGRSALFQINFTYQNADRRPRAWADVAVSAGPARNFHAIHGDLNLWIREALQTMVGAIDYRADLFAEETVKLLVERLFGFLEQGLACPGQALKDIPLSDLRSNAQASGIVTGSVNDVGTAVVLVAAPAMARDAEVLAKAASLMGGQWDTAASASSGDERNLYREICQRKPAMLATSLPMAAALAELDGSASRLSNVALLVPPAHASSGVLEGLKRCFARVHYVHAAPASTEPQFWGVAWGEPTSVYFDLRPGVSARVIDRFERLCPVGIDGRVQVRDRATGEPGPWIEAGFRGRWTPDNRLRVSDWLVPAESNHAVAEVKRRLSVLPGVKHFHVELRRTGTGEPRLMVWVQQEIGTERTTSCLRGALVDATPGFHGPLLIIDVGRLPRRADDAVVAARLEDPFADTHAAGFEFPRAGTEAVLAEIWSEVLAVERIGAHDSFAELGGNSLQALRAIQRMEARLGWRVEPRLLFFQSLRQVAARAPVDAEYQDRAA
jgi:hypothetical protein